MASAGPRTVTFGVWGPIERNDLPGLCDRVCRLLGAHTGESVDCDVAGVRPDTMTVEALARLQLAAQRTGCRIRLRHASDDLLDLVSLMGLRDVLPGTDEFPGEPADS